MRAAARLFARRIRVDKMRRVRARAFASHMVPTMANMKGYRPGHKTLLLVAPF